MSRRLERIPVRIDEMALRGVDGMGIISTAVVYLFLFSVIIPTGDSTIQTSNIIFCVSLVAQFVLSLLSDNAPYDLVYMLKGYSYRAVKIDGVEQILLCKKTVRNKESIKHVINPFRGFLVHTRA